MLCLDNAKAFDRLQHAFMLDVLRAFNLPEDVINAVRTLYSDVHTRVKLNGRLCAPFPVMLTSRDLADAIAARGAVRAASDVRAGALPPLRPCLLLPAPCRHACHARAPRRSTSPSPRAAPV